MSTEATTTPAATPRRATAARKRWLTIALTAFVLAGAVFGAWWWTTQRFLQKTDDAYVNSNVVQITPQISGTVVAIGAEDTQFVHAGQPLVQLDQADARVALDQAEAQLAKTVREVRTQFATSGQLQASVAVREADLSRANEDLARRERLAQSGAVSGEELQHARDAVSTARSALLAAQQELTAQRARIDRTTVATHPDVMNAAAKVREAYLEFARTTLPAPVSGYVAKRAVQLGQRVSPGAPLMAIVPLDQVWVDANFKEPQLAGMRVGQPVTLTADLYGSKVVYHGRVQGFGAGTGAAFSLLPAQNATGNWIKIVQRVPVRVTLDPKELDAHPLQVGLSMQAEVDTSDRDGARLPKTAAVDIGHATTVFDQTDKAADARVDAIIAANDGRGGAMPAPLSTNVATKRPAAEALAQGGPKPVAARASAL
ncbi:MAG: efflux RND transporter periplasmic adaptor subunit [Proteobacteria bacterium]|nr:efflux RND transporter periplasmic adaptor subunit [Pseudomonadota bacterium]